MVICKVFVVAIYKKRKVIVEPVFGQIKNSGFRGFSVQGKEKVAREFSLVCATHNIKKIAKAIFKKVVHPKFIKRELPPPPRLSHKKSLKTVVQSEPLKFGTTQ